MTVQDPMLTDLGNDLRDSFWTAIVEELDLSTRAANGAAGIDRIYPLTYPGGKWWERVDLGRLNLYDGENCIVGQLYGDWECTIEQVVRSLTGDDLAGVLLSTEGIDEYAANFGLVISDDMVIGLAHKHDVGDWNGLHQHAYVHLTGHWRNEIEKRRAA